MSDPHSRRTQVVHEPRVRRLVALAAAVGRLTRVAHEAVGQLTRVALVGVLLTTACAPPKAIVRVPELAPTDPAFLATLAAHTDARFVGGNRIEILLNGDETFPEMLRAIASARRTITFEEYFYEDGQIAADVANAIAERCAHGVKAHVLLDAFGASRIHRDLIANMKQSGCEVEWFGGIKPVQILLPWKLLSYNNRNHRRIVVVDGRIGFTGGYGISEAWTGDGRQRDHWRDTNATMAGPVARQLQAVFVRDWRETTGAVLGGDDYFPEVDSPGDVTAQIVASAPTGGASESYMLFLFAISTARRSISVTNPYFVIDDQMKDALIAAQRRGVQVTVVIPGQLDGRFFRVDQNLVHYAGRGEIGALLKAGIRVFAYRPAFLHAKTMVVDDAWAIIGSTNFDRRSFELNREINLTVLDARVAARLEAIFRDDLARCDELTYAKWSSRGPVERVLEWFAVPAKSQL